MQKSQLEYFVAVADRQNFTKAAKDCHLTQSAISQQIGSLEAELGFRLFLRDTHSVTLTTAGKAYYLSARRALEALGRGADTGSEIAAGRRGRLVVGIVSANQAANLEPLGDFLALYPDIDIEFTHITTTSRFERIMGGEVDAMFTIFREDKPIPGVAFIGGFDDPMALLVSNRHPLAGKTSISCVDLVGETMLLACPGREEADSILPDIEQQFIEKGLDIPPLLRLDDQDALWLHMEMGRGVLLIPSSLKTSCTMTASFLPFVDFPVTNHLGWAFQEEPVNPAARLFADFLIHRTC